MRSRPSFRDTLRAYGRSYLHGILALALNVPIVGLLLAPDLRHVPLGPAILLYVGLVALGYYALVPLVLVTVVFLVSCLMRRVALLGSGLLLSLYVYLLAVDTILFAIFKFHLDAFWIVHIFTDYDTMGVPLSALIAAILLLGAVGLMQFGLFRLATRVRRPRRAALTFVGLTLAAYALSQAIHAVAYEQDHNGIAALTPRLPEYHPVTWYREAVKYGSLLSWAVRPAASGATAPDSMGFQYPLRPLPRAETPGRTPPNVVILLVESWRADAMDSTVSPEIAGLAARGSTFLNHFSSGNSTPTGVFGIFYGIHPTYWDAIKAQSSFRDPVLLDRMRSLGYAMGIYSEHFERHKIGETVFPGIAVHDSFAGATPDQRDADMNHQLEAFMTGAADRGQPFLAFEFYKSTHYSYYYPADRAPFQPSRKLNMALPGDRAMIPLYLNDYRNAVHYVDELVGHVVRTLESRGLMRNTIIVVTGDHGEEFDDEGLGYWGHSTNFTRFQTRVPLVLYVPGEPARKVQAVTSHVDIAATLIRQVCGCDPDLRDVSNGMDLLGPLPPERPVVASSYVNHALILGDDVYSVFPMYVQRYRLDSVNRPAGRPRPDQLRDVMEEITRFRGGRALPGAATVTGAPKPAGGAGRRGTGKPRSG